MKKELYVFDKKDKIKFKVDKILKKFEFKIWNWKKTFFLIASLDYLLYNLSKNKKRNNEKLTKKNISEVKEKYLKILNRKDWLSDLDCEWIWFIVDEKLNLIEYNLNGSFLWVSKK